MAVPKRRKTRSKRDMRRNGNTKSESISLSTDILTGEIHLRHHVSKEGYYKGQQVFKKKSKKDNKKKEENTE